MTEKEIKQLVNGAFFRGKGFEPELIETHISYIILTSADVYKIKKPVTYSFLDFSTIEKRKYFCEEELRLNRRLTEGIYLEVLPVTFSSGEFNIGGEITGEVVDYALHMKRMEPSRQMHLLLEKGDVSKDEIKILAERVAAFHRQAEIVSIPFNILLAKNTFNDILSIVPILKDLKKGDPEIIEKAVSFSDAFLDQFSDAFEKRVTEGMIRDVHGDLHSGNIFLYKDPVIFDCIEFNAEFRQIDLLSEIAFFCMDMESFGRNDLSEHFKERYLKNIPAVKNKTDDKIFHYYKLYRSNVLIKVSCLKAVQPENRDMLEKILEDLDTYLNLMGRYLEELY